MQKLDRNHVQTHGEDILDVARGCKMCQTHYVMSCDQYKILWLLLPSFVEIVFPSVRCLPPCLKKLGAKLLKREKCLKLHLLLETKESRWSKLLSGIALGANKSLYSTSKLSILSWMEVKYWFKKYSFNRNSHLWHLYEVASIKGSVDPKVLVPSK